MPTQQFFSYMYIMAIDECKVLKIRIYVQNKEANQDTKNIYLNHQCVSPKVASSIPTSGNVYMKQLNVIYSLSVTWNTFILVLLFTLIILLSTDCCLMPTQQFFSYMYIMAIDECKVLKIRIYVQNKEANQDTKTSI
jgi:ATP-dependent Zn protease